LFKNRKPREIGHSPTSKPTQPLAQLREWVSRTPIGGFAVVMATLMVAESLGAWRLVEWVPALKPVELVVEVAESDYPLARASRKIAPPHAADAYRSDSECIARRLTPCASQNMTGNDKRDSKAGSQDTAPR